MPKISGQKLTDLRIDSNSDISGVVLDNVKATGAKITNVDLSGSRITDVNLAGVTIVDANIEGLTLDGIPITAALAAYRVMLAAGESLASKGEPANTTVDRATTAKPKE